ncbi:glycosyltransferase family 4 protein [Psychrobium sp. MM17-31]|uniref:glycosyltransferase family 4 protein n=1 Tax=Psychrobium sp. MM17-31 TaxID=2917758 RepID=UPI001EF59866|nr:glycosyltransferase family 4 protein [Psychrobium sp. MM17-31]MCG7531145.1 glycosyltransferase family 4 protein [Psychrobium sp. MM17-31]
MKLKYIVNANLNGNFARSVQINANTRVFSESLRGDFQCVAVGERSDNYKNIWVCNIEQESSSIRKLMFHSQVVVDILKSDVVYSRNLSVLWLASLLGKKIVWEIHDSISGTNKRIFNRLRHKLKVVAISEALKKYLLAEFNIIEKQVLVAHDGVFLDKYDALRNVEKSLLREELGLPINKTIVMHTGSLFSGRGAELFDTVIRNFPELYFVQVGGKEKDIEYWKSQYREFSNIEFFGHQDNSTLVKFQMAADLMFLPMTKASSIWWCTSPMKLFEYMATGNPICTSKLGSLTEVLNTDNSFQFDPQSEESIVTSIQGFINSPELGRMFGNKCLKEVAELYTWEQRGQNICRFIFEC